MAAASQTDPVRCSLGDMALTQTVLRTQGLSKSYGERRAVDHLDLSVRQGEIFGFLGPNGAGKTTTIRMALGLVAPSEGTVEILGREVRSHRAEVLPRVGALVENPALYPWLSGRDNLKAIGTALGGLPPGRVDAVLETVGLGGRGADKVKTYSLGMKQRLGLGIALLNDPDLLILDEPANGLDPAGIVEMRDLLRTLAASGKTVFISSHVLSEVQQICDRVAILNFGKLLREASVADLVETHGEFVLLVERPEAVLALLQQQAWAKGPRIEDGQLISAAPDGKGSDLNRFLAEHGHWAESIAPRHLDLEQIFLELTSSPEGTR